jgi:hypothetical protein
MKVYGYVELDNIPSYQRDILLDFQFAGQFSDRAKELLLPAMQDAIRNKQPRLFDMIILDKEFWHKLGITSDRIRRRVNYIHEWQKYRGK